MKIELLVLDNCLSLPGIPSVESPKGSLQLEKDTYRLRKTVEGFRSQEGLSSFASIAALGEANSSK